MVNGICSCHTLSSLSFLPRRLRTDDGVTPNNNSLRPRLACAAHYCLVHLFFIYSFHLSSFMKLRCPWLQAWEEWKIGEKARVAWDFSWFLVSHTHFCEDIQLSDTLFCLPYTVGYFLGLMGCVGEAGAFVACVFCMPTSQRR
ncbi:uncharacterized protein LY79DRAFT_139776 [Colletotrichum navitas]|uniref:Transmembrane protein n=1 Tax=Colletotrichum navitas TaxID=681940 RepID=A0AAD8QB87_9PEZI|nr:uncharacterized protein LY79DRAFT_139776 [Colletotrichum navitas]KAK1599400.1 hypothetical protein LY79DRAFT_139776 [Colletotrichum navitas]